MLRQALIALTFSLAALPAAAGPADAEIKVSFELNTDTYELEYVHTDANSSEAIDQAMYAAAGFALKLGHAEFNVTNLQVEGDEAQFSATHLPVDCGFTACAVRETETVGYKTIGATELNIVVRISIAAPKADLPTGVTKYNAGRVMKMVQNNSHKLRMASLAR